MDFCAMLFTNQLKKKRKRKKKAFQSLGTLCSSTLARAGSCSSLGTTLSPSLPLQAWLPEVPIRETCIGGSFCNPVQGGVFPGFGKDTAVYQRQWGYDQIWGKYRLTNLFQIYVFFLVFVAKSIPQWAYSEIQYKLFPVRNPVVFTTQLTKSGGKKGGLRAKWTREPGGCRLHRLAKSHWQKQCPLAGGIIKNICFSLLEVLTVSICSL